VAVADLVKVVILPSPCLDLSNLRYLAMSASSLRGALDDGRFPNLGKKITHLAIMDLDTAFQLHGDSFPNLSHLTLSVNNDSALLQLFRNIHLRSNLARLHINFGIGYPDLYPNDEYDVLSGTKHLVQHKDSSDDLPVDLMLYDLMEQSKNSSSGSHFPGMHVSMHFAHAEAHGSEMQRRYIQKAFPNCFANGWVEWADQRSLNWWLDYEY